MKKATYLYYIIDRDKDKTMHLLVRTKILIFFRLLPPVSLNKRFLRILLHGLFGIYYIGVLKCRRLGYIFIWFRDDDDYMFVLIFLSNLILFLKMIIECVKHV